MTALSPAAAPDRLFPARAALVTVPDPALLADMAPPADGLAPAAAGLQVARPVVRRPAAPVAPADDEPQARRVHVGPRRWPALVAKVGVCAALMALFALVALGLPVPFYVLGLGGVGVLVATALAPVHGGATLSDTGLSRCRGLIRGRAIPWRDIRHIGVFHDRPDRYPAWAHVARLVRHVVLALIGLGGPGKPENSPVWLGFDLTDPALAERYQRYALPAGYPYPYGMSIGRPGKPADDPRNLRITDAAMAALTRFAGPSYDGYLAIGQGASPRRR